MDTRVGAPEKLNIDGVEYVRSDSLPPLSDEQCSIDAPWKCGKKYLIRTVTMTVTGKLVRVYPHELVLETAAWIADTGRFSDAVRTGTFDEIEPFPLKEVVIIGRGSIIDAVGIPNLPLKIQ